MTASADAVHSQADNNRTGATISVPSLDGKRCKEADLQPHVATVCTGDISALRQLIKSQQKEIVALEHQLNYVLSFLGIADSIEITSQDAT